MAAGGFMLEPGGGAELLTPQGLPVALKVGAADTGRAYSLVEATFEPGQGPRPHVHPAQDEAFYVLRGELTVYVGDRSFVAAAGSFVFGPRGVPHAFVVTGEGPTPATGVNPSLSYTDRCTKM